MEFVKKNILSVICGVIALIAIITSFWPLGGFTSDLQKELDARADAYRTLSELQKKPRSLPVLKLESTEAAALKQFPNEATITRGETATAAVAQESKTMLAAAVELNKRSLLVAGSLPAPSEPLRYRFRQDYQVRMKNIAEEMLNAGRPPLPDAIKEAQDLLWENEFKDKVTMLNGKETDLPEVQADFAIAAAKVPDLLRQRVATERSIYVDESAITSVAGIAGGGAPDPVSIWSAQLSLWAHEEVFGAIAEVNDSRSIVDAPIKRLLKIDVPLLFTQASKPGEAVVASDPAAALPKSFAVSVSGRTSNALFDVLNLKLILYVDATRIPEILATMSRNRFFNVLKLNIDGVDALVEAKSGYFYGNAPVVQLEMDAELLFLRAWTLDYMPEKIRRDLGIAPPPSVTEAVSE